MVWYMVLKGILNKFLATKIFNQIGSGVLKVIGTTFIPGRNYREIMNLMRF